MKFCFIFLLFFVSLNFSPFSLNAQCIEKGNMIVDLAYGGPNFMTWLLRENYQSSGVEDTKVGGIGPLTGKFEYLLTDRVSLGCIFSYAQSRAKWQRKVTPSFSYNYKVSVPRMRVLASFNFHFGTSSKVDPFCSVGAGYYYSRTKVETDDPGFIEGNYLWEYPVAIRMGVGLRYFFTENAGILTEFGIGQALVQAGFSYKFCFFL